MLGSLLNLLDLCLSVTLTEQPRSNLRDLLMNLRDLLALTYGALPHFEPQPLQHLVLGPPQHLGGHQPDHQACGRLKAQLRGEVLETGDQALVVLKGQAIGKVKDQFEVVTRGQSKGCGETREGWCLSGYDVGR